MKETMWGIDLGGTKVEGIILRGDKEPETLVRTRVDTEAAQGYDHVIGQIEKLVKKDEIGIGSDSHHASDSEHRESWIPFHRI